VIIVIKILPCLLNNEVSQGFISDQLEGSVDVINCMVIILNQFVFMV
jgi:hypothetical protein